MWCQRLFFPNVSTNDDAHISAILLTEMMSNGLTALGKPSIFTALYGGERPNMVCAYAAAEGAAFDETVAKKCGVIPESGKIAARGIACGSVRCFGRNFAYEEMVFSEKGKTQL